MARGRREKEKNAGAAEANPEAEERKRRKRVAFSKGILSEAPSKALAAAAALSPSKTVTKHHGKDILRKSQRKNRFLFSFPGHLAPLSGGKIGDLKDLGTKNPILYLQFPQGEVKLFGTIVYPKNRYLTLQFSRGGKSVTCENYFDTMIVFSEAWWIGRKEENPEEARLELPRELYEAHDERYDFKGGAGAPSETKQGVKKVGLKNVEQESPETDLEDDLSDSQNNFEDLTEVTPVRHSDRTAGKRFNFAEPSSAEDLVGSDVETSKREEQEGGAESIGEELEGGMHLLRDYAPGETVHSCPPIVDHDNKDAAASTHFSGKVQLSARSAIKQKEPSHSSHSCLVQTTISTLLKKVEEKKVPRKVRKTPSSKASSQNLQHVGPEKETIKVEDEGPSEKVKVIDSRKAGKKKVAKEQPKVEDDDIEELSSTSKVEDDDIEELSSTSKDSDGSDEDWAG